MDYMDDFNFNNATTKEDVIEYLLQLDDENWKKFIKAMETRRAAEKAMDEVEIDEDEKLDKFLEKASKADK